MSILTVDTILQNLSCSRCHVPWPDTYGESEDMLLLRENATSCGRCKHHWNMERSNAHVVQEKQAWLDARKVEWDALSEEEREVKAQKDKVDLWG